MGGKNVSYEGQVVDAPGSEDVDSDKAKDFDLIVHVTGHPGHGFHGSHLWISRNAKNIDDGRGDIRALSTGAEGLYACALNNAVDAALSSFRKKQNPNICAIRFFGDYQNLEKCTER
ncbi:hypothetical protein PTT_18671 [Pyrenophora teres f. teres 0-1]|uniref:Uncharacterized protein n=1 Tax=Pyrenophora teres f. teres (strain 0-1) TaxID=861557 RepID=E3S794_PYRTT|nr:hypothetical protein PTT_18671 [Pyrenophora teres f. teres 0-1]